MQRTQPSMWRQSTCLLNLDKEKKVQDISFEGEGCAISMASASIMTEIIKGKEFNVAKKILENFLICLKKVQN